MTHIYPDWYAPGHVRALTTTRQFSTEQPGFSQGEYAAFNLAFHVGDDERAVDQNRQLLTKLVPHPTAWLNQTHSTNSVQITHDLLAAHQTERQIFNADASWTQERGLALSIMTADCLPILLSNSAGSLIAAIHAGWKGLSEGIIEKTIEALPAHTRQLQAWIGPAIQQANFEVGESVFQAFVRKYPMADSCFTWKKAPEEGVPGSETKYLFNLQKAASFILLELEVSSIIYSEICTYADDRLFSYRQNNQTGRQSTLIWID